MRDARVTGSAGLAYRAEQILEKALQRDPGNYDVNRTLGGVYLSQHRFKEAIAIAERNRKERPYDPVNYGVIGDGYIELGEYTEAFDAFDRMMLLKPGASAYARVAYARELQGNLTGALESMQLAADATAPADREGLAWAQAHVGELNLQLGRLRDAKDAFIAARRRFRAIHSPSSVMRRRWPPKATSIGRCTFWRIFRNDRRRPIWPRGSAIC